MECPYCRVELSAAPKRNAKCKNCGKTIYPRVKKPFFNKTLLTESQKVVSDTFESLNTNINFKVSKNDWENVKNELANKWNRPASWLDVAWAIYNRLLQQNAKPANFERLSWIYAGMADFLWQNHKDFRDMKKESVRHTLLQYRQMGSRSVRVLAYPNCLTCTGLDGKIISIDAALKQIPLPPNDCQCEMDSNLARGFCLCTLAANF